MIRIVGVQRGKLPDKEFVILQNQGLRRFSMKGLAVTDDVYFNRDTEELASRIFVFKEDIIISPGSFVALFTCFGLDGWGKSRDGSEVYFTYWGRDRCVWSDYPDANVHLLNITSTYSEPKDVIYRGMATCIPT